MSSRRSFGKMDRISSLPDSVICHILSFLPTKQSAATSILSKRWYPLWLSLLTLDFNDKHFPDFATFRHFIFSVMLSRNIKLPLHSFNIKCGKSSGFNRHDVKRLIDAVVQRGVQNLTIKICHPIQFNEFNRVKLPPCVLTCSSLTLLKLKCLTLVPFSSVKLPLLKTLHLDTIYFDLQMNRKLRKLLTGCPLLEDLQMNNLVMFPFQDGEFNGLPKLVKANISTSYVPFKWVKNAKFLCAELNFKYDYHYQVPTFHNLTHMEIVFEVNQWLEKWKWLAQVLQHCPRLQNLTIHQDSSCGNETGDEDWMDPPIVPKCLSSQLRTCLLKGYKGMTYEFQFAEFILKNAKVLHTMTISASDVDINIKLQMLMKLSLCSRGSTTCKLSFE